MPTRVTTRGVMRISPTGFRVLYVIHTSCNHLKHEIAHDITTLIRYTTLDSSIHRRLATCQNPLSKTIAGPGLIPLFGQLSSTMDQLAFLLFKYQFMVCAYIYRLRELYCWLALYVTRWVAWPKSHRAPPICEVWVSRVILVLSRSSKLLWTERHYMATRMAEFL